MGEVGRRAAGGNERGRQRRQDVRVSSPWARGAGGAAGRPESREALSADPHPQPVGAHHGSSREGTRQDEARPLGPGVSWQLYVLPLK